MASKDEQSQNLHAYRNRVSGDVFVFGVERADLANRGNFEEVELEDVADDLKEAALAEVAAADSIQRDDTDNDTKAQPAAINVPSAAAAASGGRAPMPERPADAVLSRNVVKSRYTPEQMRQRALRDSQSLAEHGVLADRVADDGEPQPILPGAGGEVDVVNPKPAGSDSGRRRGGAKKAAPTAATGARQHETQQQQQP
jgi:hypothetical protein